METIFSGVIMIRKFVNVLCFVSFFFLIGCKDKTPSKTGVTSGGSKILSGKVCAEGEIATIKSNPICSHLVETFSWLFEAETKNAKVRIDDLYDKVIWLSGEWLNGTWDGDIWESGTWHNGTWLTGKWKNGEWLNGTWEAQRYSVWENGIWHNGTWKGGYWHGGTWKNGTWKDGNWWAGIWEAGEWLDGSWFGGIWKGDPAKHPGPYYINETRYLHTPPE